MLTLPVWAQEKIIRCVKMTAEEIQHNPYMHINEQFVYNKKQKAPVPTVQA